MDAKDIVIPRFDIYGRDQRAGMSFAFTARNQQTIDGKLYDRSLFFREDAVIEATPIYDTLRMKQFYDGTRVVDIGSGNTRTEVYSGSVEFTWTRIPIPRGGPAGSASTIEYVDCDIQWYLADYSPDGIAIMLKGTPRLANDTSSMLYASTFSILDPRKQLPVFFTSQPVSDVVVIYDWTDTTGGSGSVSDPLSINPNLIQRKLPGTITDRTAVTEWEYGDSDFSSAINYDLTTLTDSEWRDMRGIVFSVSYSPFTVGVDGTLSTDVVRTVEWELG